MAVAVKTEQMIFINIKDEDFQAFLHAKGKRESFLLLWLEESITKIENKRKLYNGKRKKNKFSL